MCSKLLSNLCVGGSLRSEIPEMVEQTWLVQNGEASQGGDGSKLMTWRWLSSSGRMVESSVALQQKLEWLTMR